MKLKLTNNAETLLAGAINDTDTTVLVAPGTGTLFPSLNAGEYFPMVLVKSVSGQPVREIVYATARTGDSCTVLRGQEGTIATTFSAGDYAGCHITAGSMDGKADVDGDSFTGPMQFGNTVQFYGSTSFNAAAAFSGTSAFNGASSFTGAVKFWTSVEFASSVQFDDQAVTGAVLKDCSYAFKDAGSLVTLNYQDGDMQRWAPNAGAQTLAITNWPPAGMRGELLIEGVNLGAATITGPSVRWIKSDGTFTTSTSFNTNHGATLQTSGTDFILLWTRDGGTTIYGKVIR